MVFNRKRPGHKVCSMLVVALFGTLPFFPSEPIWADQVQAQSPVSTTNLNDPAPKLLLKPGQPVAVNMQTEDIAVTEDVDFAKEQVAAYPESPEASFILAVALTRTSRVEEALKEVRRARKLADKQGGPAYFDNMISQYEEMLKSYPEDNRVRYGLAWAYYMKAYVLARYGKKFEKKAEPNLAANPIGNGVSAAVPSSAAPNVPWQKNWVPSLLSDAILGKPNNDGTSPAFKNLPHIPGALDQAAPDAVPQIRAYYEQALKNLDELLARKPDDIWAKLYRAFLYAEYTGDLPRSMTIWKQCQAQAPNNPAPYFFLGEGYLREGNLKECLQNVSKAIALRSLGN